MLLNNKVYILGLTWRASTVDASIVVLTDGEVQRRTWFRSELFPWFDRSVSYPVKWKTQNPSMHKQLRHPITYGKRKQEA